MAGLGSAMATNHAVGAQGRLVSHFLACISSALHHSSCFFSKLRCLKLARNINDIGVPGKYLHKGLQLLIYIFKTCRLWLWVIFLLSTANSSCYELLIVYLK